MGDLQFVDGMRVSRPDRAPEWVIAKLGLKRADLIAWLEAQDGEWINVDLKRSKGGKYYAAVEERRERRDDAGTPPF
jgi:hypothetical protein